jgi:hypothetical protein
MLLISKSKVTEDLSTLPEILKLLLSVEPVPEVKLYVKVLEEKIKLNPSNYLWSHRRWKYTYDASMHEQLVVK